MLHRRFIDSACENRRKIAVIDTATGTSYTYGRLMIASLILKKKLTHYKGDYLGVLLPASAACHLTLLGSVMAGKIPVMINYATGAIKNSIYAKDKCGFETIITSKALLKKLNLEPLECMVFIEDILKNRIFL